MNDKYIPDNMIPDFEQVYTDNKDSIFRLCLIYLGDYHLAEDATQETFEKAFRNQKSFKGESSVSTWLTSIAINRCKDIKRSRAFRERDALNIPFYEPTYNMDDVDKKLAVTKAINELPDEIKEVILMRFYREMNISEIAKCLNIPESTVNYRLKKGKEMLHEPLKEVYFDE